MGNGSPELIPPHNLPLPLTSFIGREKELAEIGLLLTQEVTGSFRIVTLTGAGGTGKTRLALQVATGVLQFYADGAWFVDFAPLSDPSLIPHAIATSLRISEEPGKPLLATLVDY